MAGRILRWLDNRLLFLSLVGVFDYALFSWSVRFIDVAVAAVLWEIWPVVVILIASCLFCSSNRYAGFTPVLMSSVLLGLLGAVLTVSSQSGGSGDSLLWERIFGASIVLVATVVGAFPTFS